MPAWTSGPEEYNFLYGPPAPSIAQAIGLNLNTTEEVAPGQPFYPNLISALAEAGGDADTLYPKDIAIGFFFLGGHHTDMDITRHMANKRGVKRRTSTVGRPPPANVQG